MLMYKEISVLIHVVVYDEFLNNNQQINDVDYQKLVLLKNNLFLLNDKNELMVIIG